MRTPVFGLALGGGGARGLAHLAVLEGLTADNYPLQVITGTSMGALVAALFVRYGDTGKVRQTLEDFLHGEAFRSLGTNLIKTQLRGGASFWHQAAARIQDRIVINLAQSKRGLVQGDRFKSALRGLLQDCRWEYGARRLGVVATDLETGEDVYFRSGDLITAVSASMAIPGFVPPVDWNDRQLVDGGVSQIIPIRLARSMGADFVTGVDVGRTVMPTGDLDNALAIMSQSEAIVSHHYSRILASEADVLIRPAFTTTHWSEFDRIEEMINRGADAYRLTREQLRTAWNRRCHPWTSRLGWTD